jgi:membrane-associated phospholipid phosphatase
VRTGTKQSKAFYAIPLLAVVAGVGLAAVLPGGLKAHQIPLGACGIVLALLGIAWAADRDGPGALGYPPAAGRHGAPPFPSRLLARAGRLFAGFSVLACVIQVPLIQSLDALFLHRCYQCGGPGLTSAMRSISHAGGGDLVRYGVPLVMAALWLSGQARSLRFFAASLFGIFGLEGLFKSLVHRARPDLVSGDFWNSYPSGHALAATILAGVLLVIWLPACRRSGQRLLLWCAATVWIGLSASARLYLGSHYLTDVAGGILLGGAWLDACQALFLFRVRNHAPRRRPRTMGPGASGSSDDLEAGKHVLVETSACQRAARPSSMSMRRSTGRCSRRSTRPLGQRTSSASTWVAPARPKWRRSMLWEQ